MRRAALLAAVVVLAGCGGGSSGVPASAIAVVGDHAVSRAELSAELDRARRTYEAAGRAFPARGTPEYARLRDATVRLLVSRAELELEAERLGIRITPAQIERRLAAFKRTAFGGSETRYRERLRELRTTDAEVRAGIRWELLAEGLRTHGGAVPKPAHVRYAPGFAPSNSG